MWQRSMLRWVHILIYVTFLLGIIYASILVFTTSKDLMLYRRLYALEAWVIIGFLAIYFAMTDLKELNKV